MNPTHLICVDIWRGIAPRRSYSRIAQYITLLFPPPSQAGAAAGRLTANLGVSHGLETKSARRQTASTPTHVRSRRDSKYTERLLF